MDDRNHEQKLAEAIEILTNARSAVALTGAGLSTASGIPDFRSPESGLWGKYNPFEVASIQAFRRRPQDFYAWIRPLIDTTEQAEPNPAHLALADLEKYGPLSGVITQNIDALHTKAGSRIIHEVHGHTREVICIDCGISEDAAPKMAILVNEGSIPTCAHCGGVFKPKVILFGELLPIDVMRAAELAAESCDVMIIAGSSLEVAPVNEFPRLAKRKGAKIIIVNFQETYADYFADITFKSDVTQVLPALAAPFVQAALNRSG
ncbi:MAG: NAD-dependent protein deacylase [Chloroflexota bacterium]